MGTEVLYFFSFFRPRFDDLILIGFPPPDTALRGYIYTIARTCDQAERLAGLTNLLCSIFAVLHRRLEAIASGKYFQLALPIASR